MLGIEENGSFPPNKRKRRDGQLEETQEPAAVSTNSILVKGSSLAYMNDQLRRSNRRQKVRGEKEYIVDSNMLLRDLKVKIMETYKVAPFDQNLWVHGKFLTDPTQTLGQLRILPKSLIYLRADEPNLPGITSTGRIEEDTSWVVPQHGPEEGFKGTGLMSSST